MGCDKVAGVSWGWGLRREIIMGAVCCELGLRREMGRDVISGAPATYALGPLRMGGSRLLLKVMSVTTRAAAT